MNRHFSSIILTLLITVAVGSLVYYLRPGSQPVSQSANHDQTESTPTPVPAPSITQGQAQADSPNISEEEKTRKELVRDSTEEYGDALEHYTKTSPDLRYVLIHKLKQKNIGGLVAVILTNWQYDQTNGTHLFRPPEELGFKRVEGEKSLVNLALTDKIKIEKVELRSRGKSQFSVRISVRNVSPKDVTCFIPKGQVFENKEAVPVAQSLTTSAEGVLKVHARAAGFIELKAFCINKTFLPPNGEGNITIYELMNKNFETQDDVWNMLKNNPVK
jgi:hypothetical protein